MICKMNFLEFVFFLCYLLSVALVLAKIDIIQSGGCAKNENDNMYANICLNFSHFFLIFYAFFCIFFSFFYVFLFPFYGLRLWGRKVLIERSKIVG